MSLRGLTGKQQFKKTTTAPVAISVKKPIVKKTNLTNGEIFIKSLSMIKGVDASGVSSEIEKILKKIGLKSNDEANNQSKMLIYQLISEGVILNEINNMDEIIKNLKKLIDKQNFLESDNIKTKKEIIEELLLNTIDENEKRNINERKVELEEFIEDYLSKTENTKLFPNIEDHKINENNIVNYVSNVVNNFKSNVSITENMYNTLPTLEINRVNYKIQKEILRNKPLVTEGFYNCKNCRSKRTIDYQQQKRSGDEPMNVKVQCLDCKYSWQEC
jgi:DNA-directed RNA polymerase subunit M/transcription elongation factor TFIIS